MSLDDTLDKEEDEEVDKVEDDVEEAVLWELLEAVELVSFEVLSFEFEAVLCLLSSFFGS